MSSPIDAPEVRYTFDRRSNRAPIPPEQWDAFLDELRTRGNKVLACNAAGISYQSVWRRYRTDPEFAEEVDLAMQQAGHVLLAVAWERAIEKSDPLMLRLLEHYLPNDFSRDRRVDVQVTHRSTLQLTPEDRAALEPIKRRLLLGGHPGFVDDAEWYATPSTPGADVPETPESE